MSANPTIKQLYEQTIPSVVSVYVADGGPTSRQRGGAGSGFVYDDSHVVTNQHVVGDTDYVELRFHDGEWRTRAVVGCDRYTDLAVVHVSDFPDGAAPLPVAETNPDPGERVAAIGNPMGLDGTITVGYVSGTNRSNPTGTGFTIPETIQTDAAVNPGNSGGPLLTLDGTVVGVNRAKGGDSIGFAIAPVIVNRVVPELVAEGSFAAAYLNVRTIDVSPTVAEANSLDDTGGVLVVDAGRESDRTLRGCDRALRVRGREVPTGGDVVVGVADRTVRSTEELTSYLLTEAAPGDSVELTIRRGEATFVDSVTLGERPRPGSRSQSSGRGRRGPRRRGPMANAR